MKYVIPSYVNQFPKSLAAICGALLEYSLKSSLSYIINNKVKSASTLNPGDGINRRKYRESAFHKHCKC
jgi:hypothetical protein